MSTPNPNHPTILVIFGVTGDVVAKKVLPALLHAYTAGTLPTLFQVIGFARRDWSNEMLQEHVRTLVQEKTAGKIDEAVLTRFSQLFTYTQGNFDVEADYLKLATDLGLVDNHWTACSNKLFYLAVPPDSYEQIFNHMAAAQLNTPCSDETGWTRVLVEKPIGTDLKSGEQLDTLLRSYFKEEQIYRIEHYLAKEMLRNILAFRFANNLFEDIWNSASIEQVNIRLWEKLGVESRGNFYDKTGALRDIGQNHLLQILALVTMERPHSFSAADIRQRRAEILSRLLAPSPNKMAEQTFHAQYEGYPTITGVDPNSTTETFFALKTFIDLPRWKGVPFVLEAGKRQNSIRKDIEVMLRHPSPCLCPPGEHRRNKILISIEPEERITVEFWAKIPHKGWEMERRSLDFLLRDPSSFVQYTEEYERVLLDAIKGDQTLFITTEELRAMWHFTDPILTAWKNNLVPLNIYKPDTDEASVAAHQLFLESSHTSLKHQLGMLGLGKMGGNLARHMREANWEVIGYNRTTSVTGQLAEETGLTVAKTIEELVSKLSTPRVVWIMLPAGAATDEIIFGEKGLSSYLGAGDIIIEGGNSFYKDDAIRAEKLAKQGIKYLDVGVSGGPGGARNGACLMIGGERALFEYLEPLFRDASLRDGYAFFDGAGAGHFVKMVHNGIEYGMMQALAEGFHVMKSSPYNLSLSEVARIYNRGSVIESRLVSWLGDAYRQQGEDLEGISGTVAHTGEGAWTVKTADELGVAAANIQQSLDFRIQSAEHPDYTGQVLSALRGQFGGHATDTPSKK